MTSKGAALKIDSAPDEELEAQLPIPVGYHLLVAMPEVEEKYEDSNILKAVDVMNREAVMSIIGHIAIRIVFPLVLGVKWAITLCFAPIQALDLMFVGRNIDS